ncbi:MAG: hypothetical protein IJX33_04875 [Akkermansia sp.]|nr:hypothetical protein [Akkermansia sp.]
MSEDATCNVICLKWGTRYPAAYTNTLYRSVKKHLHRPFRFVCVTDDPTGLDEGIDAQPFPPNPGYKDERQWPGIFSKLAITQDGFADLKGPTLFLDVDVVIMDDIDCFFDYKPGENCIIHNWIEWHKTLFRKRPEIGNSSIFRFEAGKSGYIYETFIKEFDRAHDKSQFPTEQAFLTYAMKQKGVNWWPYDWAQSYKRCCRPIFPLNLFVAPKPPKTRILVFHGNPDPDQAVVGFDDGKAHHKVLPAPWIEDYWKLS